MMWRKRVENLEEKDEIPYKMLYEHFPMPNFMYSVYVILISILIIFLLTTYIGVVMLQDSGFTTEMIWGFVTLYFAVVRVIMLLALADILFFMIRIISHVWNSHKFLKNKGV